MSDWPRFPIPAVRGWNNPADTLSFNVTYNAATDVLTIVASQPVFDTVDQIDKGITEDGNTVQILTGQFSVDSTTTITISAFSTYDANPAPFTLDQLDFWRSFGDTDLIGTWTGSLVIQPALTPDIQDVTTIAPGSISISGVNLDGTDHFRVFDDFALDQNFYFSNGVNAGLNPAGATVADNGTGTLVTITWDGLDGLDVTDVQARDSGNNTVDEWFGSTGVIADTLTYPVLTGICSPAANQVRFVGTGFTTATAGPIGSIIPRWVDTGDASAFANAQQYDLDDGSPDANDWTLVSMTDTEITMENPRFTTTEPTVPGDFVINGVAFHDVTFGPMYFYEPWGSPSPYSAAIDGSGCP